MSGLLDKVKGAVGSKESRDAQPGDSVERTADKDANQRTMRHYPRDGGRIY